MSWVKNNEWLNGPIVTSIDWPSLRRFLGHFRRFRGRLALSATLALASSAAAFLVPPIFRGIQKAVVVGNLKIVAAMLAAFLAVLIWQIFLSYLLNIHQSYVSTEMNARLLLEYYRKLLNISVEDFIEFRRRSNLFQRVIDAMAVTSEFTSVVIQGLRSILVILTLGTVVGMISLTALAIIAAGSACLFAFVFAKGGMLREKRQAFLAVNYPLVEKMLEVIEGLFTIKALAASIQVTSDIETLIRKRSICERNESIAQSAVGQTSG